MKYEASKHDLKHKESKQKKIGKNIKKQISLTRILLKQQVRTIATIANNC